MRFLTYAEFEDWCRRHGYPVHQNPYNHPEPFLSETFEWVDVAFPVDSGRKVSLARWVVQEANLTPGGLLWVVEWNVWPSSEHMPLLEQFRRALGETRPLFEAPGHSFAAEDVDHAVSVLVVSLLFFWDCYFLPAVTGPVFFCSHDEFAGFHIPPGHHDPRLLRMIDELRE
jgi:hypothetical protein